MFVSFSAEFNCMMDQSLSCNSLRVYHHSSKVKKRRTITSTKNVPKMVQSDQRINPTSRRRRSPPGPKTESRKTTVRSTWTTRIDAVVSAPTTSFEKRERDSVSSSALSRLTHVEQLVPEKDEPEKEKTANFEIDEQLETLKFELIQCRDAVQYSDAKVVQLAEELEATRAAAAADKDKLLRQNSILSRSVADQKAQIKHLTEANFEKDTNLTNLKNALSKSEASSACRAVTIRSLKHEISLLRKDLAEAASSESLLQKCNKELLTENNKIKQTLEDLKNKLALLQDSNEEWNAIVSKQIELLQREGEDNHFACNVQACQKLGSLKASYDLRLQLVLKKLFRADRKTRELYQTIEKVIKGVHLHLFTDELKKLVNFESNLHMEGSRNLPEKGVVLYLSEWMDRCHDLAYKTKFSQDLSDFVLNLLDKEGKAGDEQSSTDN